MADPIKQLPEIPAERTLKLLAGRWKASLLYHLFDGPRRLSELSRLVPRANQKVLIVRLCRRHLAHDLPDRPGEFGPNLHVWRVAR